MNIPRAWWLSGILTAVGLITAITLQALSGIDYRLQEDQGLQPGWAPTWIVAGTYAGLVLFLSGAIGLTTTGAVALRAAMRQRRDPERARITSQAP